MSKVSFGKSIEYKVASEMMREGFDIYFPAADDHGIDLMAKTPKGNIVEIQVKALSKTAKDGLFANIAYSINGKKNNYYFVFYLERLDKTWILSSSDFEKYSSQNIRGGHVGKYSIDILKKDCTPFCVTDYKSVK